MGSLYSLYDAHDEYEAEKLHETFPEECDKIWNYINSKGKVKFERKQLEDLWRDFSDECYSAGFMEPDNDVLERFARYLHRKY